MTNLNYSKTKSKEVRKEIVSWIKTFKSNYVLTVQFLPHERTTDYYKSFNKLKQVMEKLEYFLRGKHWKENPVPFIAFCEKGADGTYHYHMFFYDNNIRFKKMVSAVDMVCLRTGYSKANLYLDPFFTTNTPDYCTKQIYANHTKHFNTDNIILSQELLGV